MNLMRDFTRVFFLLFVIGAFLYAIDPANIAVIHMLLVGMFLIGGTHLTRRILFHKLDLQRIAITAVDEKNMAAAIVFATICVLLACFALIPVLLLSGH